MGIRVCSLDFDGCLFHGGYISAAQYRGTMPNVIDYNQSFLDEIKKSNNNYSQTITFIGSNRQSRRIDIMNSDVKGSCFPAIQAVTDYLMTDINYPVIFDPFLMADIYSDLASGVSYYRGLSRFYSGHHAEWQFDENKLSMLYAQMHKIASEYPDESIQFDFYDDKESIFQGLIPYFENNKKTIPSNVTLNLYQYWGGQVFQRGAYQGEGNIDFAYRETIKGLNKQVLEDQQKTSIYDLVYFDRTVNDEMIKKQKEASRDAKVISLNTLDVTIQAELRELMDKQNLRKYYALSLNALKTGPIQSLKACRFEKASEQKIHQQLLSSINKAVTDFESKKLPTQEDVKKLKRRCVNAMNKADVTLRYHDNWAPFRDNLLLCLSVILVPFVIYSFAQRAMSGRYAFFDNTRSNQILVEQNQSLQAFNFPISH